MQTQSGIQAQSCSGMACFAALGCLCLTVHTSKAVATPKVTALCTACWCRMCHPWQQHARLSLLYVCSTTLRDGRGVQQGAISCKRASSHTLHDDTDATAQHRCSCVNPDQGHAGVQGFAHLGQKRFKCHNHQHPTAVSYPLHQLTEIVVVPPTSTACMMVKAVQTWPETL